LAHATFTGEPHDTMMKKAIFAADELSGFIVAVALVQPDKKLASINVKSVLKKLKVPSFAAKVSREEIRRQGADELGLPLEEHIANVLAALQGISAELGL
jgi:predicted hydrolase (HD superfamily)